MEGGWGGEGEGGVFFNAERDLRGKYVARERGAGGDPDGSIDTHPAFI